VRRPGTFLAVPNVVRPQGAFDLALHEKADRLGIGRGSSGRVQLTLPLPPSKNQLTRRMRVGGGYREYPSEEKTRFVKAVKLAGIRFRPLEGPVRVELLFYRGLKNGKLRRGDLPNYEEILFDALQGVAYLNDAQIKRIESELLDDRERPRVDVTVEQYERR